MAGQSANLGDEKSDLQNTSIKKGATVRRVHLTNQYKLWLINFADGIQFVIGIEL